MMTLHFSEVEACVSSIFNKVKETLGQQVEMTLTASKGHEILESEGARCSYDYTIYMGSMVPR